MTPKPPRFENVDDGRKVTHVTCQCGRSMHLSRVHDDTPEGAALRGSNALAFSDICGLCGAAVVLSITRPSPIIKPAVSLVNKR